MHQSQKPSLPQTSQPDEKRDESPRTQPHPPTSDPTPAGTAEKEPKKKSSTFVHGDNALLLGLFPRLPEKVSPVQTATAGEVRAYVDVGLKLPRFQVGYDGFHQLSIGPGSSHWARHVVTVTPNNAPGSLIVDLRNENLEFTTPGVGVRLPAVAERLGATGGALDLFLRSEKDGPHLGSVLLVEYEPQPLKGGTVDAYFDLDLSKTTRSLYGEVNLTLRPFYQHGSRSLAVYLSLRAENLFRLQDRAVNGVLGVMFRF